MICYGYGSAQEFKQHLAPLPVSVECIVDRGKADGHGVSSAAMILVMAQAQGDNVHYCLQVVDRYACMGGEPLFGPGDAEKHERRRVTALMAARAWLTFEGFEHVGRQIDMPNDSKRLEGQMEFLKYDKEEDKYSFVSRP